MGYVSFLRQERNKEPVLWTENLLKSNWKGSLTPAGQVKA